MGGRPSTASISEPPERIEGLTRAVRELSVLNELAREIGAATQASAVMERLVRSAVQAVEAEQGVITLLDPATSQPLRTLVRDMAGDVTARPQHIHSQLLGWMQLHKRPLLLNAPREDPRFPGLEWDERIRSVLATPLMVRASLIGALAVFNKRHDADFAQEDQRLLTILASQSAQVLENARLHEEEVAHARMMEEMRLAAMIQTDLLPRAAPDVPGYDLAGASTPARVVGGDYFDFLPLADGRMVFCVGDVSGKGLPAALLMANLQATVRGQLLHGPPAEVCVESSNRLLCRSSAPERYATLFLGLLDPERHLLTYCNAGHNPPFLAAPGDGVSRLRASGRAIGFFEDSTYRCETVPFPEGGCLVVYSDGITEAENEEEVEFGEARLEALVRTHHDRPAAGIVELIKHAVEAHLSGRPPGDDRTLLVVRRPTP
jgi:phosphoserine phosphatase RsbU/P